MNKSKLFKITTSIIAFIILIAITLTSIIAATTRTTLKDLINEANNNSWFDFNPTTMVGSTISGWNSQDALMYTHNRCLDPRTGFFPSSWDCVNVIDLNITENKVKVYGLNGNEKEIKITDEKAMPVLVLAILANRMDEAGQDPWRHPNGEYQLAIWQLMQSKQFVNKLIDIGLYPSLYLQYNSTTIDYLRKYGSTSNAINKAYEDAYALQQEVGSEKASLSINMSEKDKQNVRVFEQDGKTYIGPYKLKLNNGCKVQEINVINKSNETKKVSSISTDSKTTKNVENVKDNENFYIVTDVKPSDVKSISVKGNTSVLSYKARFVFLSRAGCQNYVVWNSVKTPITPEITLEVPEKGTLEIIKNDEQNNSSINLSGIGFKVYKEGSGWLKEDGTYSYFKDGKEFFTGMKYDNNSGKENKLLDLQGNIIKNKIIIDGISLGTYRVYETSIPESLQKYYKLGKTEFTTKYATKDTPKETAKYDAELAKRDIKIEAADTYTVTHINKRAYADFQIKKVDKTDSTKILNGIAFKLASVDKDGKITGWVTWDNNNVVTKTDVKSFDEAKRLTVKNDNLTEVITHLPIGKYKIFETDIGEHLEFTLDSYIESDGKKIPVSDKGIFDLKANQKGATVVKTVENEQQFVSISGIVWEDIRQGKNDKEINGRLDNEDYRINGIFVRLVDDKGNQVQSPVQTGIYQYKGKEQNGVYRFDNVKISELKNYHVEFSYDGITYQSVTTPQSVEDETIKSSAVEVTSDRNELNNAFSEITGEGQVVTYKNQPVTLSYNKVTNDNRSTVTLKNLCDRNQGVDYDKKLVKLTKNGDFIVTSTTENNYLINKYNNNKSPEITDVNLGLYQREQTNLALYKDVDNAEVSINGAHYTYKYGVKDKIVEEDLNNTNVETTIGVRFKSKNPANESVDSYSLPFYMADVRYDDKDNSKDLNTYITYKISLANNSNSLYAKVNSLKEVFSKDLTFEKLYTINEKGQEDKVIYDAQNVTVQPNGENYSLINFDKLNIEIAPYNTQYVYIKFKLPKESIYNVENDTLYADKEFDNHAEISSYSISDEINNAQRKYGYATYDVDSIPNNYDITKSDETDENDSDYAPGIKIVDAGERTISGTVFEDSALEEYLNKNERLGNGIFEDGENLVQGVKVRLVDANNNVVKEVESNEDGNYTISGFIPGNYKIEFVWGQGKENEISTKIVNKSDSQTKTNVTVDTYKSTIWTEENKAQKDNKKNEWYKVQELPRYSDALDNWETRKEIDKKALTLEDMIDGKTLDAIMTSSTREFFIGVEVDENYEQRLVNKMLKYIFDIKNVDFGLIERPRQVIDVDKHVNSLSIKDNNNTYVQGTVNNDTGKLEGTVNNVSGGINEGFFNVAIKPDTLQGANINVGYRIVVNNNSELDYATENYYLYGTLNDSDRDKIVTIKVEDLYDYLRGGLKISNEDLAENATDNSKWAIINNADINNYKDTIMNYALLNSLFKDDSQRTIALERILNYVLKNHPNDYNNYIASIINNKDNPENISTIQNIKCFDASTYKMNTSFELAPGDTTVEYTFNTNGIVNKNDNLVYQNDVEIGNATRIGEYGRNISLENSNLYNIAEPITLTDPTGENRDYTPIVIIAISAIAVLGVGIVVIKKTVLKK